MRTFTILISLCIPLTCLSQSDKWIDFEKSFKFFIAHPTHDNSIKPYNLLPNKSGSGDQPNTEILDSILLTSIQLDKIIVEGNEDAVKLGFKLYTIADGEFAESLNWTLGKLIITNPILFLKELKNHRQIPYDLDGLVGNNGPDIYNNQELDLKVTGEKIKSLKKISDSDLNKIKDECLNILLRLYDTMKNMPKEK